MSDELSVSAWDNLVPLNYRLYCLYQAICYGDDQNYAHLEAIRSEIHEVWSALNKIIKDERMSQEIDG